MSVLEFSIYILASGVALSGSYAYMMSILQRQINMLWTRSEAIVTSLASVLALVVSFSTLKEMDTLNMLVFGLLFLGLLLSLGLVVYHHIVLKNAAYPEAKVSGLKSLAAIMLGVYLLQMLIFFAVTAGF